MCIFPTGFLNTFLFRLGLRPAKSADEKFWFNSPRLAPEIFVRSLLRGLIPFIKA